MLINLIVYLLQYLPEILIVSPILYWAYRELRTERQWIRLMRVMVPIALLVAGAILIGGYPQAPHHNWSHCRLAPAIAWVKGYALYTYPEDGPMLVQMYGPISAMVYLPSAVAGRPTTAVMIGVVVNTLLYILPAGWFLFRARRGQDWIFSLAALAGFLLFTGRHFALKEAATLVTIDAPAVGLAVCALAVLARAGAGEMLRTGLLCGLLAGLSIWTKLTLAPIVVAMGVYVLMSWGLRPMFRFIGGMAISGLLLSGALILGFGLPLLFQNVVVPAKQPWQWPRMGTAGAYLHALELMWRNARPLGWLSIAAIGLSIGCRWGRHSCLSSIAVLGDRSREPVDSCDGVPTHEADKNVCPTGWARDNPWLLPLLVGIAVIPTSALAYVKYGGSWNNTVAPLYLILLAAVAGLSGACGVGQEPELSASKRLGRVSLALLLILGCWMGPQSWRAIRDGWMAWGDLAKNENETAFRYARDHPGDVYFPSLPLASLMAQGRLYHFDAGIDSLYWAGYSLTDEQLRAHLPERMRAVGYRADGMVPALMSRLTEFEHRTEDPSLPGWILMTRNTNVP